MVLDNLEVRKGFGRHIYYLVKTPESRGRLTEAFKLFDMNIIDTALGIMFVRLSIMFLLLRIFGTKKMWRWAIHSIGILTIASTTIYLIAVLAHCQPISRIWNPLIPGRCWDLKAYEGVGYFYSGQFLDFFITLLGSLTKVKGSGLGVIRFCSF